MFRGAIKDMQDGQRGEKRDIAMTGDDSPTKNPKKEGEITLSSLQKLLEAQTRDIRQQTADDIGKAIRKLEASTLKKISEVQQDVQTIRHQVSQQDAKIDDVKRGQSDLAARIVALEAKGSPSSTSIGDLERRLGIIVGGWRPDTCRDDIVGKVNAVLETLQLRKHLDSPPICPGVRRAMPYSTLNNGQVRHMARPKNA